MLSLIGPPTQRADGTRSQRRVPSSAVRLVSFLVAAGGVGVAVVGLLRLALSLMLAGAALWAVGVVVWELAMGRFH